MTDSQIRTREELMDLLGLDEADMTQGERELDEYIHGGICSSCASRSG